MKAPTLCPVCREPLLNNYTPRKDSKDILTKSCQRRVDHAINMIVDESTDVVESLSIGLSNKTRLTATWMFNMEEIWIWKEKTELGMYRIPYFEPDLSNYQKLVNKVKTYLVFS